MEVKSTYDGNTNIADVSVKSDAKVIKNNKRSAQHQLRDHMEVLEDIVGEPLGNSVQVYIMWPFLSAVTRDPKQASMQRWKEDKKLHVFENVLTKQEKFDRWFVDTIFSASNVSEDHFVKLLNRLMLNSY